MRVCIATKTVQDEQDPYLRHVTVLEVEGVTTAVINDFLNQCIKSFYCKNNKIYHSRLQLNDAPWGIAKLEDRKVMVAVPDLYQIVTVAVNPQLIHIAHINTSKKYSSLAVISPSKLAAGNHNYVDILNMQGEVMKSVTSHNNMELFQSFDFMTVSNTGHLLVSDTRKMAVICLTPEGEEVWTYMCDSGEGKLKFPRGITVTAGGDILVADAVCLKIIQLSESGEYVRDVLTSQEGLTQPQGISVDKYGSLYIGSYHDLLKFVLTRK